MGKKGFTILVPGGGKAWKGRQGPGNGGPEEEPTGALEAALNDLRSG